MFTVNLTQLRLHVQNTLNKQNNKLDSSAVRSDDMNKCIGAEAVFKVPYTFLLASQCDGTFI